MRLFKFITIAVLVLGFVLSACATGILLHESDVIHCVLMTVLLLVGVCNMAYLVNEFIK